MKEAGSIRILYIEDDVVLAHIFQKKISSKGYVVDIVKDGKDGLTMHRENPYDLLLLDYNIPTYNGLEVIRILLKEDKLPPTIMITGAGSEEVAVEAMKLGIHDYIVKDINERYMHLMPIVIENVLIRHRLLTDKEQTERDLEQVQKEKHLILNSMLEQVLYLDKHMNVKWVNKAIYEDVGSTPEKMAGYRCHTIMNYSDEICGKCPVIKVLRTREHFESEVMAPDGRLWFVRAYPVLDAVGDIEGVVVIRMEITASRMDIAERSNDLHEHLLSQKKQKERETFLRVIVENIKDIVYLYRYLPEPRFEYISPAVIDITGYTPEEFYANPNMIIDIVDSEDITLFEDYLQDPGLKEKTLRVRWKCKNGDKKWIDHRVVPVFDNSRNLIAIAGIARYIIKEG